MAHDGAAPLASASRGPALSGPGGVQQWLLCLADPPALDARPGERTAGSGDPGGACAYPEDVWAGTPPSGIAGRRVFIRGGKPHERKPGKRSRSIEFFYNRHRSHSRLGNCSPATFGLVNSQRHELQFMAFTVDNRGHVYPRPIVRANISA